MPAYAVGDRHGHKRETIKSADWGFLNIYVYGCENDQLSEGQPGMQSRWETGCETFRRAGRRLTVAHSIVWPHAEFILTLPEVPLY